MIQGLPGSIATVISKEENRMSATPSTMISLGTEAPFFDLKGCDGERHTLDEFSDAPALLVVFMCNHCPYVKHIRREMVELISECQKKGVAVVGINSNDAETYPDDGFDRMIKDAWDFSYTFPYLVDETQVVAKVYGAACTPDFFIFDRERKLAYRGQMDDSRPGNEIPVTGKDLRAALDAVLNGLPVPVTQKPSIGCNIKWKKGNEPEYFYGPL
ncbi:MAG: thioredoxin family protein [Chitinispirillaceae bacterium]|nr:thioredoxin family protein [Chitinispirillaceae bacterium]